MANTNSFLDKYNKFIARTFGYQIKGQCTMSEEKRQVLRKKRKKHKKK